MIMSPLVRSGWSSCMVSRILPSDFCACTRDGPDIEGGFMRQRPSFIGPALALTLVLVASIEDGRPTLAQANAKLANVPTVVIGVSVSIWPAIAPKEKG